MRNPVSYANGSIGQEPRGPGGQLTPTFSGAGSIYGCGPPLFVRISWCICQTSGYVIENAIKTRFRTVRSIKLAISSTF